MNLLDETHYLMRKYNIHANKDFGQNFLVDEDAIQAILSSSDLSKDDLVIEIGPGLGTLTHFLLENAGKVISIELDKKMNEILHDRFIAYDNFTLINEDVLKIDLKELIDSNIGELKKVKVVANLPYYITTPIIMKLLEENLPLTSITVMVQKEVAERLSETPGGKETGSITYTINYYADAEIVQIVPKESFVPSPKVDSAVLKLSLLDNPRISPKSTELFFKVIKFAFMQKRKTLVNSLTNSNLVSKEQIEKILTDIGLDLKIRAEQISIYDFEKISNKIFDLK